MWLHFAFLRVKAATAVAHLSQMHMVSFALAGLSCYSPVSRKHTHWSCAFCIFFDRFASLFQIQSYLVIMPINTQQRACQNLHCNQPQMIWWNFYIYYLSLIWPLLTHSFSGSISNSYQYPCTCFCYRHSFSFHTSAVNISCLFNISK